MSRVGICYKSCHPETQTVAPTLPGFQGIKRYIKYLDSQPHKPIFYLSTYYDGSNVIRIPWSVNKFEYQTTQNCLECHQYADNDRITYKTQSVSGIIHTILGVSIC